jgi:hypothetical protein
MKLDIPVTTVDRIVPAHHQGGDLMSFTINTMARSDLARHCALSDHWFGRMSCVITMLNRQDRCLVRAAH